MAKYKRVDADRFYPGLPSVDELDDETLANEQKYMLYVAVDKGLYEKVQPVGRKGKTDEASPPVDTAQ